MKKIYVSMIILSFIAAQNHATSNKMLIDDVVIAKSRAIETMITRHNYMVNALAVMGYAHNLALLMPGIMGGLKYFFNDEEAALDGESYHPLVKKAINQFDILAKKFVPYTPVEKKTLAENVVQGMKNIGNDAYNLFFTSGGWLTIGKKGLTLGGYLGGFFILQRIAEQVQHPDTLRWYISTKAPYMQTTEMIKTLAKKLSTPVEDEKKRQFYHDSLVSACYQLVKYGEDICAYTLYKSMQLEDAEKESAERISRYIFNYNNDVFASLFNEVDKKECDYGVITHIIINYEQEMKFQRNMFSVVEGEIKVKMRNGF